jgi:hypothetical protein
MTVPTFNASEAVEVARVDDWIYDFTLEATSATTGASAALTTGTVTAHLCVWPPSLTPLSGTQAAMTHLTAGRWLGALDVTAVAAALAPYPDGTRLAIVYVVDGAMGRYREAVVVTMRRSEV